MALQKTYNKFGMDFTNAYHCVENVSIYKSKNKVVAHVQIYNDNTKTEVLKGKSVEFDYADTLGTLASVYTELKTLPEYSGAVDV